MRFNCTLEHVLAVVGLASAQFNAGKSAVLVGGASANTSVLGNYYNYWLQTTSGVWDLTRSARSVGSTASTAFTIPCNGNRKSILIEPSKSALVIIDMQNFFLHPALSPRATLGRGVVNATVNMVKGFRKAGMKVLWTNWGLNDYDLLTIPPAFLDGFSSDHSGATVFGSDMGFVPGTNISAGMKLMRGSWNARPYGPLYDLQVDGVASGTDMYFHKNRLFGPWGAQTTLGLWLQENQITTLFFGGVNADQCVVSKFSQMFGHSSHSWWGTFLDAYYKGFDVVYVEDISATTSPYNAIEMVKYNANLDGFLSNSTQILPAIA